MSESYENYNKELKRAWNISTKNYFSDTYFNEIENKLSKFHRGLVIFAKMDQQICNGGFWQLFDNGYVDALEEAISFLDETRYEPEFEQYADKVINTLEEALEVHTHFIGEISCLDKWEEWHEVKAEYLENSRSSYLIPLDHKYYKTNEDFLNRLESYIERRFVKPSLT
ncbi:MAG: DUF515 domain-containing protein [Proteobacteria bacterium]|nr:DUF515 domain-containing protein [Pseudomonadota bacterium]MBU1389703.1 DUF515 domain-containing protein [Pseudomonadota bacterium]MBU1542641.1 DUF515 domain-containing protein [Pseudomonadota bacterium]MBU2479531.1 DUF515 domain-containing protein [Pseudomonadota bacterium]